MSLASVIQNAVRSAHKATLSLQTTVRYEAWVAQDVYGQGEYAPAVNVPVIVERKVQAVRNKTGQEVQTKLTITILDPIRPNGAPNRDEPIDPRDKMTLPSGETGVLVVADGMMNPETLQPFLQQVYLG